MTALWWRHGDNDQQEYWTTRRAPVWYQVLRPHAQAFWVLYRLEGDAIRLVPNPGPAEAQLCFVEVTALPAHGEAFGDRPHHDVLPETLSPNYAWDDPAAAMAYCEQVRP